MSTLKIFSIILFSLMLISCQDIPTQKIKIQKKYDSLTDQKGQKIYYGKHLAMTSISQNQLAFIDGNLKKIYIANDKFKVMDTISLVNYDYLFKATQYNLAYNNNWLYLIDATDELKKVNLENRDIRAVELKEYQYKLRSHIGNIEFINDTCLVGGCKEFPVLPVFDTLYVGVKFNTQGEFISSLSIPTKSLGYNSEFINSDQNWEESYISTYENKIYVSFKASKKVLVYSQNCQLEKIFQLGVNEKFWNEPHLTSKGFYIFPVNTGRLLIINKIIYQVARKSPDLNPSIKAYNLNFEQINEWDIYGEPMKGFRYKLFYVNDKFIIKNASNAVYYSLNRNSKTK